MVCLLAAPWVQLSVSAGNGWPHNALRHHLLMPISCHFRDCKALLVTSVTHVSGAIAIVQTFIFYLYMTALNVLCVQLTCDLFAIAKFFFHISPCIRRRRFLGRSPSEYCHPVWCVKTRMVTVPDSEKNFEDVYNHDRIPACDRRTSCDGIVRAMHTSRTVRTRGNPM